LFQLVDAKSLALVTVVVIIAGQTTVGRLTAGVSMVLGSASYVLWANRNKGFVVCTRLNV
jgi:hypothetical protein